LLKKKVGENKREKKKRMKIKKKSTVNEKQEKGRKK
jgi:hypothetical protein